MSNEKRIEESKETKGNGVFLALTDSEVEKSFKEENLFLVLRGGYTDKGFCKEIADGLYLHLKCKVKNTGDYVAYAVISEDNLKFCFPDISIQEAFEIAKANTLSQGIKFEALSKILSGWTDMDNVEDTGMYILTYETSTINGATLIAFPEVIQTVQAELGCKRFYIIPSSVHEVIIISEDIVKTDTESIGCLNNIIGQINGTELAANDILSDKLYYYDGENIVVAV